MLIAKLIVFFFMWFVLPKYIRQIKISGLMKKIRYVFSTIKYLFLRIYRILTFSKTNKYVWKDLIKYHKRGGWRFGQFDNDKYIECSFKMDDTNFVNFSYTVDSGKLIFRSSILQSFDEDKTSDVLVLASHFNSLLNFGVVKVSINYNCVDFVYTRDLLTYSMFSGEIDDDITVHFNLSKDIFWSFSNMVATGDDPVFVFSELMKRREEKENNDL